MSAAPSGNSTGASRLACLAAFTLLTLVGVLGYAGPGKGIVLYHLVFDGGLLLLWLFSAWGFGDWILSRLRLPFAEEKLARLITSIAIGLGIIGFAMFAIALIGALGRISAFSLLAVGIVLALVRLYRAPPSFDWLRQPAGWEWLFLAAAPFLAIAITAAMFPAGMLWREGDPSFYDVLSYHLQVPREWFEAGRMMPLHHNVYSFLPFNVEMHYLLAMELRGGPWAGMYLAQLMHLAMTVLSVLAVYAFARRTVGSLLPPLVLRGRIEVGASAKLTSVKSGPPPLPSPGVPGEGERGGRLPAVIAALAVATIPFLTQLGAVAYVEGGFLLFGVLAIGWAAIAIQEPERHRKLLVLAGMFAGLCAGAKLTGVPEILIGVGFVAAVIITWNESIRAGLTAGAIFVGVGLLVLSPWLIRNVGWGGNPIFPEAAQYLGHDHWTSVQVERWDISQMPRPDQRSLLPRLQAGWVQVAGNWQYGYVLLPLGVAGLWCGRRSRTTWFLFALLLWLTAYWLFGTHLQGRFFVLAIPLCGLLIARIQCPAPLIVAAVAVLIGAFFSFLQLHRLINSYLYRSDSPGMVSILGMENLSGIEGRFLDDLPPGTTVVLAGDAKAFWYVIPMSRLRYRTVFDVGPDTGSDLATLWNGGPPPAQTRLIVDPEELERLHKYYWKMAAPPAWVEQQAPRDPQGRLEPFAVDWPGGKKE